MCWRVISYRRNSESTRPAAAVLLLLPMKQVAAIVLPIAACSYLTMAAAEKISSTWPHMTLARGTTLATAPPCGNGATTGTPMPSRTTTPTS